MGVRVIWDDENTKLALRFIYDGIWTWEENYRVIDDSVPMFEMVSHMVDIIIDMTNSSGYPAGNLLSHFRNMADRYHERSGHSIIINDNAFLRMMSDTFSKVYKPKKIKGKSIFVQDLAEARTTLQRLRKIRQEVEKKS